MLMILQSWILIKVFFGYVRLRPDGSAATLADMTTDQATSVSVSNCPQQPLVYTTRTLQLTRTPRRYRQRDFTILRPARHVDFR